jgi:hypothetical protein
LPVMRSLCLPAWIRASAPSSPCDRKSEKGGRIVPAWDSAEAF